MRGLLTFRSSVLAMLLLLCCGAGALHAQVSVGSSGGAPINPEAKFHIGGGASGTLGMFRIDDLENATEGFGIMIYDNQNYVRYIQGIEDGDGLYWSLQNERWEVRRGGGLNFLADDILEVDFTPPNVTYGLRPGDPGVVQCIVWNGTQWEIQDCSQFDYTADSPINIVGRNISLGGCALNEILKWDGDSWECAADDGTTYTGTAPIDVTGTVISLTPCPNDGQNYYYAFVGGAWICQVAPNTTPWDAQCADGQVMIQVNSTGGFTCVDIEALIDVPTCTAPDQCLSYDGTDFVCIPCGQTYTGTAPIDVTGTVISLAPCADDQILVYDGGWQCVDRDDVSSSDCTPGQIQVRNPENDGWDCVTLPTCGADEVLTYDPATGFTCVAVPGVPDPCGADQVLTYSSGAFSCVTLPTVTAAGQEVTVTANGANPTGINYQVGLTPCPEGETRVFRNGVWECELVATLPDCATNDILVWDDANSTWICTPLPTCGDEFHLTWNGTAFVCDDDPTTIITNTPDRLTISGPVDNEWTIDFAACGDGQVLVYYTVDPDGAGPLTTGWNCVDQEVTDCPDNSIPVSDGTDFVCTDVPVCGANSFLRFDGTGFTCAPLTAEFPVAINNDVISLAPCGDNQFLLWDAAANGGVGAWTCAEFDIPTCDPGQYLTFDGTDFVCVDDVTIVNNADGNLVVTPSDPNTWTIDWAPCAEGQTRVFINGVWECRDTFSLPACADGQIIAWDAAANGGLGAWVCTNYAVPPTCGPEQYLTFDGTDFVCVDDVTDVLQGSGITVVENPANDFTVSLQDCAEGQQLTFINGVWECRDTFSLPVCTDGQILAWDAAANGGVGAWVCADFDIPTCDPGQYLTFDGTDFVCVDDVTNITNTDQTLTITRTDPNNWEINSAPCTDPGQFRVWDGTTWTCVDTMELPTCAAGQYLVYDGTDWVCADTIMVVGLNPIAVTTTGNIVEVSLAPCQDGEAYVYRNGAWTCELIDTVPECTEPEHTLVWNGSEWECRKPWLLGGNNVANPTTEWIGTITNQNWVWRTNSVERARVLSNGPTEINHNVLAYGVGTNVFQSDANVNEIAIHGRARGTRGYGVVGSNLNARGIGILGLGNNLTAAAANIPADGAGVVGNGTILGLYGEATSTTGDIVYGVQGYINSNESNSAALYGLSNSDQGATIGASGITYSADNDAVGVFGMHDGFTGTSYGVYGVTNSVTNQAAGVVGLAEPFDVPAGPGQGIVFGVIGQTKSNILGATGVQGIATEFDGQTYGVLGSTSSSDNDARGVVGLAQGAGGATQGVYGRTFSSDNLSSGVRGLATDGLTIGVWGENFSRTDGMMGVLGLASGVGTDGLDYIGVAGRAEKVGGNNIGVFGFAPDIDNVNYAGYFDGDVFITGDFGVGGTKSFKIDHPTDPANKYLVYANVESNEVLNYYSGNVVTDANGEAVVELPSYVGSITADCRYNLTPIGQFAQAIVLRKFENNRFTIKTDKPNVEVSWTMIGVRNDKYMQANPFTAEQSKGANSGKYVHPELYGQPADKGLINTTAVRPNGDVSNVGANDAAGVTKSVERANPWPSHGKGGNNNR